jgi:D-arabinan exo alpha-(1,3)/(1,5)-arabinofuranosidase (non-reducing end)
MDVQALGIGFAKLQRMFVRRPDCRWGLAALAWLAVLAGCGGAGGDPAPAVDRTSIGYRLLLGLDRLDEPRPGVARLFSSHAQIDASNEDYNHYLSREDEHTFVLAEHQGPGVITRIWMTARVYNQNQHTTPGFWSGAKLSVYTDGDPMPLFSTSLNRFFAGEVPPFVKPLVNEHQSGSGPSGKGFYCYVPIAFAAAVKVTVTDPLAPGAPFPADRFFYQIDLLDLTGAEPVEPTPRRQADGSLALSEDDQRAQADVLASWRDPQSFAARMESAGGHAVFSGPLAGAATVATIGGPGQIVGLRIKAPGLEPADLDRIRLQIHWDEEAAPAVDVPLGVTWGCRFGRRPFAGLALGAMPDGTLYLRLPMPYRRSARVDLLNAGAPQPVSAEVFYDSGPVSEGARMLHAAFVERTVAGQTRLRLLQAAGAGHLAGLVLDLDSASGSDALEGDEFITADGAALHKGTGTEDFFNADWSFEGGPRSLPLHGAPFVSLGSMRDVAAYRFLVPDAVPFRQSLLFELENGNRSGSSDRYSAVCFYYLAPSA